MAVLFTEYPHLQLFPVYLFVRTQMCTMYPGGKNTKTFFFFILLVLIWGKKMWSPTCWRAQSERQMWASVSWFPPLPSPQLLFSPITTLSPLPFGSCCCSQEEKTFTQFRILLLPQLCQAWSFPQAQPNAGGSSTLLSPWRLFRFLNKPRAWTDIRWNENSTCKVAGRWFKITNQRDSFHRCSVLPSPPYKRSRWAHENPPWGFRSGLFRIFLTCTEVQSVQKSRQMLSLQVF